MTSENQVSKGCNYDHFGAWEASKTGWFRAKRGEKWSKMQKKSSFGLFVQKKMQNYDGQVRQKLPKNIPK